MLNRFLMFFVLVSWVSAVSVCADPYLLRNKYSQGEACTFNVEMKSEGMSEVGPVQRAIDNETFIVFAFQNEKVEENGNGKFVMELTKLENHGEVGPLGGQQDLLKMLGLEGVKMNFSINPRGIAVEPVKLPNQSSSISQGPNQLNEQLPWLYLPENELEPGATWVHKRDVPITGVAKPIIAYTTYTLTAVSGESGQKIANITSETSIDAADVEFSPESVGINLGQFKLNLTFKEYSYHSKGTIVFNIDEGHIVSKEEVGDMVQVISSDMNQEGASFPSTMNHKFQLTTKGEYKKES